VPRTSTRRAAAAVSLGVVLAATCLTLALSLVVRAPCASGEWSDGRQYRRLCYSDLVPLYATEYLQGERLPFLDPCPESAGKQCDEYPVVTMYLMRLAAWIGSGYSGFFYANVALLAIFAGIVSWALYRMAGPRALYFAAAPTLLVYAFVNWDLLVVALATGATLAYLQRRDAASGALLGVGAAAKLYPAFLVIPFALGRLREGRRDLAMKLVAWAGAAYVAVNLPFALAAPEGWLTFFRFNSERPVDWDSLWFIACQRLHGGASCSWSPRLINALSLILFVGGCILVWRLRRRREPDFARWTFGFPLLIVFLLTSKVYSPQYGLWLLPWFGLVFPNLGLFLAFSATDVAVFVTRFTWFGRLGADAGDPAFQGFAGPPIEAFQAALLLRAAVLLVCLAVWVWGKRPERPRLDEAAEGAQLPEMAA
jgi:uncharacterized membrane protein